MSTQKSRKKYRKTKKQMGKEHHHSQIKIHHPLSPFIKKKVDDKFLLVISKTNKHLIDLQNMYIKCFLEKMLEILKISFNKEKNHHIKLGNYSKGYEHSLNTIISNLNKSNFLTYIATDKNLVPISFLYIEKNELDYDKMWSVCTDPKCRGKGYSSFVVRNSLKDLKKNNRKQILLEIYNDNVINRQGIETPQKNIIRHFSGFGFKEIDRNSLSQYSRNNLLSNTGEARLMTCNL